MHMKQNILIMISSMFYLLNAEVININNKKNDLTLINHGNYIEGSISIGNLEYYNVTYKENDFVTLTIPGYHFSQEVGLPRLPQMNELIELPQDAIPRIEILSQDFSYYKLDELNINNPIFPHQPSLSKSQDINDIQLYWNKKYYNNNSYNDKEVIRIDEKGTLRSIRIGNLNINPINYNPVNKTLKVISDIQFNIYFDEANYVKTNEFKDKYYSPYFNSIYENISNYDPILLEDDLVDYPVTYVIITNPIFENSLSEFINWKTQKGYKVVVGNTSEIGSSTETIKSFIQNLYENPTDEIPAPSFVLFVGDVTQVPTYNGSTGGHVTDLYFCEFTGDLLPEIYHGRMSAENLSQLESQLNKTLEYEKFEMPDPSYLEEVLMVSGVDGSFAAIHGNGQINYGTTYYFNEDHGVSSHTYLYPESDGSGAAAAIIQDFNDGVGFSNYTAHCSEAGWADPSFTTSDIPGLTNTHQYGTMVGNCCTSLAFDYGESFGEAILRAENSGAIGYLGGTNSTYWDEDYWWGVGSGSVLEYPSYEETGIGIYDGMFHENGEDQNKWFVVNDAINMAGNLAVMEAGSSLDAYYWEIYHVMGDPSITTYIGMPSENNVEHLPILQIGTDSFDVSADPYSHIAISMDGILYGTAFLGNSNNVQMPITPFSTAGTATIVVTGQNKQPYIGQIEVGNAEGPYVVIDEFSYTTSNGNDIIEFNETINLSMNLKNVGNELTEDVQVNLSTVNEYINIVNNNNSYGNISPQEITNNNNEFSFYVASNVPNDYSFTIIATITGSNQTWEYNLNMKAFCPVLEIDEIIINDENSDGQVDPGDLADIGITIFNEGGALVSNLISTISISDPYVTLNGNNTFELTSIESESSEIAYFSITANEDTPIGHIVSLDLSILGDGNYSTNLSGSFSVGLTWEDFESGAFINLPWNSSGDADWTISQDAYDGTYSAQAGLIDANETSELNISVNVTSTDYISFYYKVSSEGSYDYLRFYIDSIEMDAWSGEEGWSEASYLVSSGEHTFRWVYSKDSSVDSGSDTAWIDYILFPPIGAPAFSDILISLENISLTLDAETESTEQFSIENIGQGELQYSIQTILDSPDKKIYESLKLSKGEKDPRSGIYTEKDFGGPDAFGYSWYDSNEEEVSYNWTEISLSGTEVSLSDDDNVGPFELGFPFYFYGNEYNAIRISSNGFASFTSTSTSFSNQPIPSTDDPNAILAPFWTDLNPSNGGAIYYHQDRNRFIIEWKNVPSYSDSNSLQTFQIIIIDDGTILFNYQSIANANECTVGIENENGTDGLLVVYNANYLENELTIKFKSNYIQPWVTISPLEGIVMPNDSNIITALFNSSELLEGIYTGNINVFSNDPDQSSIILPISMTINSGCNNGGDINDDQLVNVQDIVLIINCILTNECIGLCTDLNNNGTTDVVDIVLLVNLILD